MVSECRESKRSAGALAVLVAAFFAVSVAGSAGAAPLDASAQRCANGFIKYSAKVLDTVSKSARSCHMSIGKGGGGGGNDISDCVLADEKGKLTKANTKTGLAIDKYCSIPYPMTCPQPCETLDDGGATTDIDDDPELAACLQCFNVGIGWSGSIVNPLLQGVHGAILKNSTIPTDPIALKCQSSIIGSVSKVLGAKIKSLTKCIATEFKGGAASPPVNCIANLSTDSKVGSALVKLGSVVLNCSPPAPFDGGQCAGLDGAPLVDCMDTIIECRACRWANGIIGGTFDCDAFDNGIVDASCVTP